MSIPKSKTNWMDITALISMGVISVGYVLFQAVFAEMHVKFSFLNFPVFVGEFLLVFCAFLFLIKMLSQGLAINRWHALIAAYFAFVLIKAFYGYGQWGPLAFRHAALMYYPVFAVFAYTFFQRKYFTQAVTIVLLGVIFSIFAFKDFYFYYTLTLFVLALILIRSLENRYVRMIAYGFLLVLTPYRYFFHTARMMILAHLFFAAYIIFVEYVILKWPRKIKILLSVLIIGLIVILMVRFAGTKRVRSIFDLNRLSEIYMGFEERIQAKKGSFKLKDRAAVQIFNPNTKKEAESLYYIGNKVLMKDKEVVQEEAPPVQKVSKEREFKQDLNNAVFRLFLWRDMFVEYKMHWPVLGFDYGKPFRSESLEILRWAEAEWKRDGWVSPHNSFFHIIYRAGLVGLIFIGAVVALLLKMIKGFITCRSMPGILLCGLISSWFVAANFLVVLEIPYSAIPIWCLYGLTFRYYHSKMELVSISQKDNKNELEK